MNTKQVVKKAVELKTKAEKAGKPYDAVWTVFDKDSFPDADFDAAVNMAEKKAMKPSSFGMFFTSTAAIRQCLEMSIKR